MHKQHTHIVIDETISDWKENDVLIDFADENDKEMARKKNRAFGARVVGNCNEKLEFL